MSKLEPIYLLPHRDPLGGSGVRTDTPSNAACHWLYLMPRKWVLMFQRRDGFLATSECHETLTSGGQVSPHGWGGSPAPHPQRLTPGLPPTPIPGHSRVGVSCAQQTSLPRPLLLPTDLSELPSQRLAPRPQPAGDPSKAQASPALPTPARGCPRFRAVCAQDAQWTPPARHLGLWTAGPATLHAGCRAPLSCQPRPTGPAQPATRMPMSARDRPHTACAAGGGSGLTCVCATRDRRGGPIG